MIDRGNDNLIPIDRGHDIKEEEIAKIQERIEKVISRLKELHAELSHEMEMAHASGDEEQEEHLQGQIFGLERDMEEGEKLIMEGHWERADLWKKSLETKWKREDGEGRE